MTGVEILAIVGPWLWPTLATLASGLAAALVRSGIAYLNARARTEHQRHVLDLVDQIVAQVVAAVAQGGADALRNRDGQLSAYDQTRFLGQAMNAARTAIEAAHLTEALREMVGEIEPWLTQAIESAVRADKQAGTGLKRLSDV